MKSPHSLYITGGAVPGDALFYIPREADTVLYEALQRGELCYVLTPRQMGKSSLVIHTAQRLRKEQINVVIIDLQNLGLNLTPEQWYLGLLDSLGRSLNVQDRMDDFIAENETLSPLQLWQCALRDVVLPLVTGPVVIFIDEIDTVRGLTFSTDEFFGAIRACFNARAEHPQFYRLTFCLLGVATPADLIRNPRLTPFNIGSRIDLHDFTFPEAIQLQAGLGHDTGTDRLLMERIYFWTGGHPCLTQRLCKAIAENGAILTPRGVDECCRQMFLTFADSGQRDDNLLYVQQRLLPEPETENEPSERTDERRAALLSLYAQIVSGKPVPDNEANALVGPLKLSGAVRAEKGLLRSRNRIYAQVFDRAWIREQMPEAERRRQKAAYRRGMLRAASVGGVILGLIGGLAIFGFQQARRAQTERDRAERLLYAADMSVIHNSYSKGDYGRVLQLLEEHEPKPDEKDDLRGFEWRYYWRLMHQDRHTFKHAGKSIVFSAAFSPDNQTLASSNGDGTIKLWDAVSYQGKGTLSEPTDKSRHTAEIVSIAFSPTGRLLASGSVDKTVKLWDIETRRVVYTFEHSDRVYSVVFSRDGRWLASGTHNGELRIWDVNARRAISYRKMGQIIVGSLAFSPDKPLLASGQTDGTVKIWEVPSLRPVANFEDRKSNSDVWAVAFAPGSELLAVGRVDGRAEIWDITSQRRTAFLQGHKDQVSSMAFSPDSKHLATGSWDNTVRLWDVTRRKTVHQFLGHRNRVTAVTFSPNGKYLASTGHNEIKIWDPHHWEETPDVLTGVEHGASLYIAKNGELRKIVGDKARISVQDVKTETPVFTLPTPHGYQGLTYKLSPDEKLMAVGYKDGTVILLDVRSGQQMALLRAERREYENVCALAFSPDGKKLAVADGDPARVTLWDIASGQKLGGFIHGNTGKGIALSPDGKTLAAASWSGRVYLWDTVTGAQTAWLAHTKWIEDVAFSPDGKTLASASSDSTVKLWNVATRREMITFQEVKPVRQVVFSSDGTFLAAVQADNRVQLYRASTFAEIETKEREAPF